MLLSTAVAKFTAYLRDERFSDRTIESYVLAVERTLGSFEEWGNPTEAKEFLQNWRKALQTAYGNRVISDSKIRVEVAALRKFYAYFTECGLLLENPCEDLKSIRSEERLPRPMPVADIAKLMAAIPAENTKDRAMMELFLNGLRNVEVCRMTVEWIDYAPQEETLSIVVIGKGNREGEVMLSPDAALYLAAWILEKFSPTEPVPENLLAWFGLWKHANKDQWGKSVFDVTRQKVNLMFNKYRGLAGLSEAYGPHSLRHSCGTELLERGVDIRVVQEILRHKNLSQTVLYTKVRRGPKADATRRLPSFKG